MTPKKKKVLLFTETADHSRYWEMALPLLIPNKIDLVYVALRQKGPVHSLVEKFNCPNYSLNGRGAWDYARVCLRLAQIIRREKIEVVHGSEPVPAALAAIASKIAGKSKVIFHRHHALTTGKQSFFSRIAGRFCHLVMAVSRSAANSANQIDRVRFSQIRVAYNGIDPMRKVTKTELMNLREKLAIPETAKVITIVSRLRELKGHRTLFEAARILHHATGEKPHLVIVGSGPDELALKTIAKTNLSAHFHFVGHQEDVALWFSLADVAAMPSHYEAFGLTALEAISCGVPMIASRLDGIAEIIENETSGILVEPKNAAALAEAILRVLHSKSLASKLSREGEKRAGFFTVEAMVASWQSCYELL